MKSYFSDIVLITVKAKNSHLIKMMLLRMEYVGIVCVSYWFCHELQITVSGIVIICVDNSVLFVKEC